MLEFQEKTTTSAQTLKADPVLFALVLAAFIVFSLPGLCPGQQSVDDQYRLAAGSYSRGEFEEAIRGFTQLANEAPDTEKAKIGYFYIGESQVQLQDYEAAYQSYQVFRTQLPYHENSARTLFRMGECAFQLNRYGQAASLLEKFVWTYPDNELREYAMAFLGDVRMQRGEPQLAKKVYESALQYYPQSTMSDRYRFGLAKALQAQGYGEEAARFFRFITSQSDSEYRGASLQQLGILDFKNGMFENARSNLTQANEFQQGSDDARETTYWLARTEMASGNYENAFEHFQTIAADIPDTEIGAAILFDGAVAAARTKRDQTAIRWLSLLRQRWPNTRWVEDALEMQIELAQQSDSSEEALVLIQQFNEEFPDSQSIPRILEYAGRIQYDQHEYQKSIDTFSQLFRRFEANTKFDNQREVWRYYIGLGYLGLKEFEQANIYLSQVKVKTEQPAFQSLVAIARATTLVGLGRSVDAIPMLKTYLNTASDANKNPTQLARAQSELAIAYVRDSQWDNATNAMQGLVERKPVDQNLVPETAFILAETAFKAKKYRYSETWFEIMTGSDCTGEFVERGLSGLGWSTLETDQQFKSMEAFSRLLEEFPDSQYAAEAAMAQGKYFEEQKQHAKATAAFEMVSDRFGETKLADTARLRQAYNLQKLGGKENLKSARSVLLKYLSSKNEITRDEAIYQLAWINNDLEDSNSANRRFEELSSNHSDSRYWVDATYRVADEAFRVGQYKKADQALMRLLAEDVSADVPIEVKSRSLHLRGQIAAKQKNWTLVGATMTQLIATTDNKSLQTKGSYWLGESLFQRKEYEESGTVFGQLISEKEFVSKKLTPWIKLRHAQCLAHIEKWSLALAAADVGLNEHSNFNFKYEFNFIRGRALAAQGRLIDARAAYEKVIKSPQGGSTETAAIAQWRIGETYFHQQEYKQAIAAYYKVDSLFAYKKWRAASLMQAGKCQEHLGNWKHAIKLYKQLVTDFASSEYAQDAGKRMELAVRQANLKQIKTR